MDMIMTIRVDETTQKNIKNFVRFCYDNNINEIEDIGALATAIEDTHSATIIDDKFVNITYK